jgi:hypothetical protein
MSEVSARFRVERETKNKVRFKEVDENNRPTDALMQYAYLKKNKVDELEKPEIIEIIVRKVK